MLKKVVGVFVLTLAIRTLFLCQHLVQLRIAKVKGFIPTVTPAPSPLVFFPYAFVNLLNPVYAYVTALFGRNIFWADGSYTNVFGKTKAGKPAGAPEEAHAKALANLEARRAAGKAPKINA